MNSVTKPPKLSSVKRSHPTIPLRVEVQIFPQSGVSEGIFGSQCVKDGEKFSPKVSQVRQQASREAERLSAAGTPSVVSRRGDMMSIRAAHSGRTSRLMRSSDGEGGAVSGRGALS